jgi:hypothetical protein
LGTAEESAGTAQISLRIQEKETKMIRIANYSGHPLNEISRGQLTDYFSDMFGQDVEIKHFPKTFDNTAKGSVKDGVEELIDETVEAFAGGIDALIPPGYAPAAALLMRYAAVMRAKVIVVAPAGMPPQFNVTQIL